MLKFLMLPILMMIPLFSTVQAQEISPARMPRCTIAGRVLFPIRDSTEIPSAEPDGQDPASEQLYFEHRKHSLRKYLIEQYNNYKCQGQWYGYAWTLLETLIIFSATAASLLAALGIGAWPQGKYLLVATSTTAALSAAVLGQFNIKNEWLMQEKGAAMAQLHMAGVDYTRFGDTNSRNLLRSIYVRSVELDLNETLQALSAMGNVDSGDSRNPSAAAGK